MEAIQKWNPAFVAYANSRNLTPEQVLIKDEKKYPGGKMTGFILFMDRQGCIFDKEQGYEPEYEQGILRFRASEVRNTKEFHKWLNKKFKVKA